MSTATKKFGAKKPVRATVAVAKPDTINVERFPAFQKSPKTEILQALLTGTLGNTFYATADKQQQEASDLITLGVSKFPSFTAKAAAYARQTGFMRTLPVMALAHLAAAQSTLFERYIEKVILTPNDLRDFMVIFGSLRKGQGGRMVKRVVGKWMADHLNPYWVIKYGSEGKEGYSLKDLFITIHPRGVNHELADYIMRDTLPESLSQIVAFERFKKAENEAEALKWVAEGKLPMEVVTPFAGAWPKIWEGVALNAPIQATLKNLVTLNRHGVLETFRKEITARLTQEEAIQKARLLPYQVFAAFQKVKEEGLPNWTLDMIRLMYDGSVKNVKVLPGKTLVAIDESGSMRSHPVWEASLLGITVARACEADAVSFDTNLRNWNISKVDSVMSQADHMVSRFSGGGTETSLVSQYLIQQGKKGIKYDNLWLFTDEQQNTGTMFYRGIETYRKTVNPNLKLIIVDVTSYSKSGGLAPEGGLNWVCSGVSLGVIDTITLAASVDASMVGLIEGAE